LIVLLLTGNFAGTASAASGNHYTVRTGDTLSAIGKRHGLKYHSIMLANKMRDSHIYPGQKLVLPLSSGTETYFIRPGDNLYRIAGNYGLKVNEIMAANGLKNVYIRAGDRLTIPVRRGNVLRSGNGDIRPVFGEKTLLRGYSDDEITLLARLIHAEARGEAHRGKVAVGAVIMNRIASGKFPASIREVVFQKTKGVYQFTPVKDGNIHLEPAAEAYRAAIEALHGTDPTGGALFFYNPEKSSDRWIRTLPVTARIGNHVFAK